MDGEDAPLNDQVDLNGHFIATILEASKFYVGASGKEYDHPMRDRESCVRLKVRLDHEFTRDGSPVVIAGDFSVYTCFMSPTNVGEQWRVWVKYNRESHRSEVVDFNRL